jgi:FkbM family methyltransferase
MIPSNVDLKTFLESLQINLKCLREFLRVTNIELSPQEDSPLYFKKHPHDPPASVKIACDNAMAVAVLAQHAWQPEELKFTEWVLSDGEPITLVDVGANMGLFTRQVLAKLQNIENVFVYEPHPGNFELLSFNLAPFERIEYVNAALSDIEGQLDFFLDPENCGNYSLNKAAMPTEYSSTVVKVKSAFGESRRWLAHSNLIFYKSDTQGFDELIATQFDMLFWESVVGGIMELWRIDKPNYDAAKLEEILDSFPNKTLLHIPSVRLSTADVLDFIGGRDRNHADLGFWR